jgi:hypothetical protein
VIPFSRAESTSASDGADQLDKAGQTILQMLHRAAGVAEENSRHALETAQKLSHQLRAAEDRADLLNDRVLPFFEEHDVKFLRVLNRSWQRVLRQSRAARV